MKMKISCYNCGMRYFLLLLLAGCASPQERASRHIELFGEYCEALGHQVNSASYGECVQMEAERNNA